MGFHAHSADGEGDRTVACAIDYDKPATGELEGPCLDGRGAVSRSDCQTGNKGGGAENVSDVRYASLKRYLAKRFHPDYAPGQGIEKIVRNEIFKEIWNEIDRLDQGVSATRGATARSAAAA